MPKLKLGAAVYAFAAAGLLFGTVRALRNQDQYEQVHGWLLYAAAAVTGLSGVLLAVGAVTRRGLIAEDGPWLVRNGWILLGLLTVVGIAVAMLIDGDAGPFVAGPAVFVPHWVRRSQEWYHERAASREAPDEVPRRTS